MITDKFKTEINRRLDEGASRIETCLSLITPEDLWRPPGGELVSIGNLINHLCGNISQWVLKTLGGAEYIRKRDREFSETTDESREQLAAKIRATVERARAVVSHLTGSDLDRTYTVQGYRETGVGILVHVVEHLSYHVGQITFYVKQIKGVDVGYYSSTDLNQV